MHLKWFDVYTSNHYGRFFCFISSRLSYERYSCNAITNRLRLGKSRMKDSFAIFAHDLILPPTIPITIEVDGSM